MEGRCRVLSEGRREATGFVSISAVFSLSKQARIGIWNFTWPSSTRFGQTFLFFSYFPPLSLFPILRRKSRVSFWSHVNEVAGDGFSGCCTDASIFVGFPRRRKEKIAIKKQCYKHKK